MTNNKERLDMDDGEEDGDEEASFFTANGADVIVQVVDPIGEGSPSAEVKRAGRTEILLIFLCGIGCNLGWTAVLSNLVFYTMTLGMDSYLLLNLMVFGPILPITLAQVRWDSKFDKMFDSRRTFPFRGHVGFAIALVATFLLPWASRSLSWICLATTVLGSTSAALQGTLKQLGAFIYPECGYLAASVTAGMQASAICVLVTTLWTGFGAHDSEKGLFLFYWIIAIMTALSWAAFFLLMICSQDFKSRLLDRQLSIGALSEPLLEENMDLELESGPVELEFEELWLKTRPSCAAIIPVVSFSMFVASWFNRVQSQYPHQMNLPQILFYTRLLSDLVGRLVTVYLPLRSSSILLFLSLSRLVVVPVFFVYISTDWIPKSDTAVIIGVSLFAFGSGYLSTTCYQIAPLLLEPEERPINAAQQAGIINVCFAAAIFSGIAGSLVLRETGFKGNM